MSTTPTRDDLVTLRLSEADKAELAMLAKTGERSLSAEIRLAIRAWLVEQRKVAA